MKVNKTQCCYVPACVHAKSLQLCPALFDAMECSLPDSSVHGIFQTWSGLPFPSPGDLPDPGTEPVSLLSPTLAGGFFTTEPPGKPSVAMRVYNEGKSTGLLLSSSHQEDRRTGSFNVFQQEENVSTSGLLGRIL